MYKPMFTNAVCLPVYRYNSTFTDDDMVQAFNNADCDNRSQTAHVVLSNSEIRRLYRDPVSASAGQARKLAALCQVFKASEMRVRVHVCWRWVMALVICMSGGLAVDASAARDDVASTSDGRFNTQCHPWGNDQSRELCRVSFYRLIASRNDTTVS